MKSLLFRLNLVFSIIWLVNYSITGQTLQQAKIANIVVDSIQLSNPLAGGLNAPQFSNVDFNNDGLEDVLIFDRVGGVILPMINEGDSYRFDPSFVINFPVIENFLLMKDFNNDGIADIFCFSQEPGIPGVSVFKGKYSNDVIDFDIVKSQNPNLSDILNFQSNNNSLVNIAVSRIDIPSIEDIDGDGDLDIVTFNFFGGKVEYYQNLVLERNESLDNFFFIKAEDCYGGILESGQSEVISLASSPGECAAGFTSDIASTRHAGSTLLSIDSDADGDFELLLGDVGLNNITLLENGGDEDEAYFNKQILRYPDEAEEPVDITIFPGAFYADVDRDGIKDFIAAPNNINASLDTDNVWFYRNDGVDNEPILDLKTKALFVGDMLDLGTATSPAFVDLNDDQLVDMVVGTQTTFTGNSTTDARLYLFLNMGTTTNPVFELVDDNWLDFQRFNGIASLFKPSFADSDGDGDMDLIVGERNGSIFFVENLGGSDQYLNFSNVVPNYMDIDVGQESSPFVYDLDKDGLLDLLIGEQNGNINFFKNIGTSAEPDFDSYIPNQDTDPPAEFNIQTLGQVDTRVPGVFSAGSSKPVVVEIDGIEYLAVGSGFGALEVYIINSDLNSDFEILDENFGDIDIGTFTTPAIADLNDDGILEVMIGNRRGGLSGFTNFTIESVSTDGPASESSPFALVSNLVNDRIILADNLNTNVNIFSTLGQLLVAEKNTNSVEISNLIPGIYFINLEKDGRSNTLKVIKQ